MKNHILICGLNGSGKSTFGKALAKEIDAAFKDIEDFYFPNRRAVDAYTDPRSKEEVSELLLTIYLFLIKSFLPLLRRITQKK